MRTTLADLAILAGLIAIVAGVYLAGGLAAGIIAGGVAFVALGVFVAMADGAVPPIDVLEERET